MKQTETKMTYTIQIHESIDTIHDIDTIQAKNIEQAIDIVKSDSRFIGVNYIEGNYSYIKLIKHENNNKKVQNI